MCEHASKTVTTITTESSPYLEARFHRDWVTGSQGEHGGGAVTRLLVEKDGILDGLDVLVVHQRQRQGLLHLL